MYTETDLKTDISLIRLTSPLIHNITNYVVMNNTANALLAIGASPVMSHAVQEVEQMVSISSALVINVGTLSASWVQAMELAMLAAKSRGIPIIYDPVGAGATDYRDNVNRQLLSVVSPTIIRGNGSEIISLVRKGLYTKGVDSTTESSVAVEAAKVLSSRTGSVVVISGPTDYIVKDDTVLENTHGVALMGRVTGMGCTATAICGAFAAVNPDPLSAALGAMQTMGICGEMAYTTATAPGSFQVSFIDSLFRIE